MIKNLFTSLFILMLFFGFSIQHAKAGPTTEQFLDNLNLNANLPISDVDCKASGSLGKLIDKQIRFMSRGNAFFVSTADKKMAIFESGSGSSPTKTYNANVFIKATNVSDANLRNLLVSKKIVITNNAQVIFALYVTENNVQKTYLYDGAIEDSIVSVLFKNVGNSNNKKYIVVDGIVSIYFPRPPQALNGGIALSGPGAILCSYKQLPLDDDYLPGIEEAFDGSLVGDIKNAAGI